MIGNHPDYAIEFGKGVDKGVEDQKAFPFIYTFVSSEDDKWEAQKATNNLIDIGPTVPANSTVLHPVRIRQDYPFLMLWMKFTAYYKSEGATLSYIWYEPVSAPANWFLDQFDYNQAIGTPLIDSIDISVWFQGPSGRFLYGGQSMQFTDGGVANGKIPLPINTVQGYDFGYSQLRTPYFLPTDGQIMFEITNRHALKDLTVGALIYGLKVRV